MKSALLLAAFVAFCTACTTLRPTEAPVEQIQRRVLSGELVAPGDRVRLVTADATVHEFRVAAVDLGAGTLIGKDEVVRVTEIVALEKRELSWLKTGLLVGGLVLGAAGSDCEDDCNEYGGLMCC